MLSYSSDYFYFIYYIYLLLTCQSYICTVYITEVTIKLALANMEMCITAMNSNNSFNHQRSPDFMKLLPQYNI